uniref:Alpha-macroglobulin receptor-binding domain-containing protein n=1 Tax=Oncorhynchus mykiss TaxID=8022 RepID=A0A8C7W8R8_ONCMY
MWEDTNLPECPAENKHCESTSVIRNIYLKDSITFWEIRAISLSKIHGICVADPFEMIVLKEFFIDLKLPYSAVRNEQLEVKAILHNNSEDPITVCVELMENDEVCSSASKKGKYRQERSVNSLPGSMAKAVAYLEKRLPHLTNPYAVAMISYALANAAKLNKETLLKFASPQLDHWPVPGGHQYTLEATSYALLALVKVKAFEEAGPIVRWLNKQKKVGGGYGSTQSTIMVFQAVAEYWSHVKDLKDFDLNINLEVAGRASVTKWFINNKNQFLTRTDKVNSIDKDLTVKASGSGEATLSVVTLYYALPEEKDSDCESFDLSVTLTKMDKTSHEDAKESFMLTIDMLYRNSERDATMSILDIGLLTGFIVDTDDLKMLSMGRERYIEKFEMNKVLSEKGSLILYLDKVSHKLQDRISFKIHRVQEVGVLQPAAVSVYEYYNKKNCRDEFAHLEYILLETAVNYVHRAFKKS